MNTFLDSLVAAREFFKIPGDKMRAPSMQHVMNSVCAKPGQLKYRLMP